MGVVLGLVVFARLYGQMVQVAIAEKTQSFIVLILNFKF